MPVSLTPQPLSPNGRGERQEVASRLSRYITGDTANKVGTCLKALAARAHGLPFYIAAPWSTIDLACPGGREIPIEERDGDELRVASTASDALRCVAEAEAVFNPAFDVTPASLINGVVTERGVFAAQGLGAA